MLATRTGRIDLQQNIDALIDKFKEGARLKDIGIFYHASPTTISKYLKANGMYISRFKVPTDKIQEVIDLYNNGMTLSNIAKRHHVGINVVHGLCKRNNVLMRKGSGRIYRVNDNCFDEMSETVAYWLGFLMADGCVTDSNELIVCLSLKDEAHLEKLQKFLKSNRPIRYFVRESGKSRGKGFAQLSVTSAKIVNRLKSYGIVQRKTGIETSEFIPSSFKQHFFRGYIDGDGCFSVTKNTMTIFLGSSSQDVILQFREWVNSVTGKIGGCFQISHNHRWYTTAYKKRTMCRKIIENLYDSDEISLDRKRTIALGWLKEQFRKCLHCEKVFFPVILAQKHCTKNCRWLAIYY